MSALAALRREMVRTCRAMNASGINQGTSGNLSARLDGGRFLITPSGLAYETMKPADLPVMDFSGRWWGPRRPSTEWRFHRDILRARPDVMAVLHVHSRHATALACLGEGIPAFHYMVAAAGGAEIACAPYATFGTQALSDHALAALGPRRACLLANHGLIVAERSLAKALALAIEVETLAAMYLLARQAGRPKLLSRREMARVLELFRLYGTPEFPDADLRHEGAGLTPRRGR
ncbi:MAG: class II aldolase/adducin family protein [Alphaproteobacteria bacterium]|nr:class II aldolase/adducin family protein [Alphaproteobacteria bacterium]